MIALLFRAVIADITLCMLCFRSVAFGKTLESVMDGNTIRHWAWMSLRVHMFAGRASGFVSTA